MSSNAPSETCTRQKTSERDQLPPRRQKTIPEGQDFGQNFVKDSDKCLAIIDDVDKLDSVEDGFIHYQLLRFCQATRLHHFNGQIRLDDQQLNNHCEALRTIFRCE